MTRMYKTSEIIGAELSTISRISASSGWDAARAYTKERVKELAAQGNIERAYALVRVDNYMGWGFALPHIRMLIDV